MLAGMGLCAQGPQPDAFLGWLDRTAQKLLDERAKAIAEVRTVADAERRKALVRATLERLIGGLPQWNGPLRARVTGELKSSTHTVEKVIFESLPGVHVTGNLYRPNAPGRYPGVLVPSGHTQEGKPEPQIVAANLAAKGFVALTWDPIGQGEREQSYVPQLGRALAGGGGNEHLELGARSILIGQSVARYFIFDARRAMDYLVSRPDVDAGRLGVTGCSGGGAIATYAAVFDRRIKVAAPGCFLSTFRKLFTGPTPDSEMSLPQFLASGLDQADYFELVSPMPWLLMATEEDYFTPEAARPVFEEAQRWYGLYGAAEKIRFYVGKGPHGTGQDSREQIYAWMIRWLKDGKGDAAEVPVKLYTNLELRVTASGNVQGEAGNRRVYEVIRDEYHALKKPLGKAEMLVELARLGAVATGSPGPAQIIGVRDAGSFQVSRVRFESEPGVVIEGQLYVPKAGGRKPAVVVVEEKRLAVPLFVTRSQSTEALAEAFAKAGAVVLEMEPRDSPAANDGRPFLGNWLTNERVDLVGGNLAAMRARDILSGVSLLAGRGDVDAAAIHGYARGVKGFWMMMAAAVDKRLSKIWLDRTPVGLGAALEGALTNQLFDAMAPGFALHWDFADLRAAIGERRVMWTDPTNWMNQVIAAGAGYRYRLVSEGDETVLKEFLK